MPFDTLNELPLGNAIYPLLLEAQANVRRESRRAVRYPFFHCATLTNDAGNCYRAFTRDISANGVGLLHRMEIPLGEIEFSSVSAQGNLITVRTQIVRCQPCGDGWHVSGGEFVAHTLYDLERLRQGLQPVLREARDVDEREDRSRMRYPCFRSAWIILDGGIHYPAFSRDISESGIGLIHEVELPSTEVEIQIATGRGYQVTVRTQLTCSQPCGQDWYLSGGRFTSIPAIL